MKFRDLNLVQYQRCAKSGWLMIKNQLNFIAKNFYKSQKKIKGLLTIYMIVKPTL